MACYSALDIFRERDWIDCFPTKSLFWKICLPQVDGIKNRRGVRGVLLYSFNYRIYTRGRKITRRARAPLDINIDGLTITSFLSFIQGLNKMCVMGGEGEANRVVMSIISPYGCCYACQLRLPPSVRCGNVRTVNGSKFEIDEKMALGNL